MLNVERITKIFACDAEKCFVTNVKCPTWWPHFGSKSPLYGANSSQMPGVCPPWGMGGFGIDCYIISDSRIWILQRFSKIWKGIMNLNNPYSNSNLWRRFTKSGCAEGIIHAFCWVQTRTKDTLEKVFLRKCQALCFHSVLFSGLKRVL